MNSGLKSRRRDNIFADYRYSNLTTLILRVPVPRRHNRLFFPSLLVVRWHATAVPSLASVGIMSPIAHAVSLVSDLSEESPGDNDGQQNPTG